MIHRDSLYIYCRKIFYTFSQVLFDIPEGSLESYMYSLFNNGMILTKIVNACVGGEPSEQFIPK